MKRSSTPTHSFALPFVYERYVERFVLTYKQGESVVLTKTEKDFGKSIVANGNVLAVSLTQEETIRLSAILSLAIAIATERWVCLTL